MTERVPFAGMRRGSAEYRRASLALFLAGNATFSLLYCVQPLLPEFAREFALAPASASLALSLTSGALAVAVFLAGAIGQAMPRRSLMLGSLALASALNLAAAFIAHWPSLVAARLLEGVALGGVPAVAMAYIAEEMHPTDLVKAMGLYVAGTAFGGMMGRIATGLFTEWGSWRLAMGAMGGLGMAAALGFGLLLPPSRRFVPQRGLGWAYHRAVWWRLLRNSGLLRLFLIAFVLMSMFVTLFNYVGFRLSRPPFSLGHGAIGAIFLTYVSGIFSSSITGHLAEAHGRRPVLALGLAAMLAGALLTLSGALAAIVMGILLLTLGFFSAHAVASGWVGQWAGPDKGHAASLYLLFYYLGAGITGTLGGWFYQHWQWGGVVALTGTLGLGGLALALSLGRREA